MYLSDMTSPEKLDRSVIRAKRHLVIGVYSMNTATDCDHVSVERRPYLQAYLQHTLRSVHLCCCLRGSDDNNASQYIMTSRIQT